jgi:elongation factor P--(R)-beta-lysine ligase
VNAGEPAQALADWHPSAAIEVLRLRAQLLATARRFFAERQVLEVDTPVLVNAAVTQPQIECARVLFEDGARPLFLHTSPEYAMKRLLAAGSGDLYQICHVVRGRERSRLHNPEFTLIEWYRLGFDAERLMDEVAALVGTLLAPGGRECAIERLSYREVFQRALGLDPLEADLAQLESAARDCGYRAGEAARAPAGAAALGRRDELLDFLMAVPIGPQLGRGRLTFVHRYPASQAALARLDPQDPRVALRFELYAEGVELANGFEELADAAEQRSRFLADQRERLRRGLPAHDIDERLISALRAGLPPCSGVALGFDRTLMLAAGAQCIDDVLAFSTERA